jgi:hypothetical protein
VVVVVVVVIVVIIMKLYVWSSENFCESQFSRKGKILFLKRRAVAAAAF